ncbi:MAG TPA: hypothetical protein VER98_15780 [Terriglobia bacterium]|nr:hypothetical protein [Terriglobia bacterium]
MSHISELDLFDYVAGKADLTTQGAEHLQDCGDCRERAMELRRLAQDHNVEKTRRLLAEEGDLLVSTDPPKINDLERELDETPGS